MGLFGKKKADNASADQSAPGAGDEMKTCEKCGKEKPLSEGNMVLEGSAFCCNECCPKGGDKHEVCEFC